MPSESPADVKFEIGHVLFIDIVGYSKLLINEQSEQIQKLREIVRGTEQFRLAEAEGKLLRLPTGDGSALVFRTSPEAPVLCALEISKALKSHPELHVRMGIHSGPVNAITDLNEQANIAGAGINIAQRVMDCGDAGHILLSKHVAEDLEHYPRWQPGLHDLGECEVKHGARVSIVNLYTDDAGNAALPTRLAAQKRSPAKGRQSAGFRTLLVTSIILIGLGVPALIFTPAILKSLRSPISGDKAASSSILDKSIAVLPFENLSEEKANAYFAEGIQNEILTKLATVRDLKVISRTSTAKYQSKPDNLKTVANELGVATVLEGAVQKSGDKVRVNVQLIDARTDSHLWAKTYDRDFKDVFAVESEVAQEITDTLQAKLSPSESHALASVPTQDPQAYDLFLQGEYQLRAAESVPLAETYARAEGFYRQAIARDPKFAEAYAALAYCSLSSHWFLSRRTPAQLAEVKLLIDRALELAPNSPEAHLSLAIFHYWGHRQYDAALAELDRTLNLQPNNAKARQYRAWILRRQGKWEQSLSEAKLAQELDPRDGQIPANIALDFAARREWNDAERYASRALAIDPNNFAAVNAQLAARLSGHGDIEGARQFAATRGRGLFPAISAGGAPSAVGVRVGTITGGFPVYLHVIARQYAEALAVWDTAPELKSAPRSRRLSARVAIQMLAGQTARDEAEEARVLLEKELSERPDDLFSRSELAWVYLALDRKADALRLSREVANSLTIEMDAPLGAAGQLALAEIEAWAGEPQEATNRLRHLLSIPSAISIAQLKIDPVWDPIRNDPGFQQLLTGKEHVGP